MKVKLVQTELFNQFPQKAHNDDAGWDVKAISGPKIVGVKYDGEQVASADDPLDSIWRSIDYIEYDTGIKYELEEFAAGSGFGTYFEVGDDEKVTSKLAFSPYWFLDARPRSSISSKTWLSLCNAPATLDFGYRGNILLRFRYNYQPSDLVFGYDVSIGRKESSYLMCNFYGVRINKDKIYKKGDAIAQLVPMVNIPIEWEWAKNQDNSLSSSSRGDGGFGSSDHKKG